MPITTSTVGSMTSRSIVCLALRPPFPLLVGLFVAAEGWVVALAVLFVSVLAGLLVTKVVELWNVEIMELGRVWNVCEDEDRDEEVTMFMVGELAAAANDAEASICWLQSTLNCVMERTL